MPSTTATDGASISMSVMEVVENFGLEANIVGITSDGGGNLWVYREALESKHTNESISPRTGPERKNTHIVMPSTTATDGASISMSVMEVVENFGLEAKIVGIMSDGGGNLQVFREALELKYTNDYVSPPHKPLFTMECLAHILSGDCKSGLQLIKSDDGEVDTELTRRNV